jgi:MFS family permease
MPNGHPQDRDRVRRKSRFWSAVWQVGDASYYLGLLGSVVGPVVAAGVILFKSPSWNGLFRGLGLATILFLACFPAGLLVSALFKGVAEQMTGGHD